MVQSIEGIWLGTEMWSMLVISNSSLHKLAARPLPGHSLRLLERRFAHPLPRANVGRRRQWWAIGARVFGGFLGLSQSK